MRVFLTLVLGLAFAGAALADFDKARDAYNRGEYKAAFEEFKQIAEQGDARAQFYLAESYNNGQGSVQDYAEALNWYRKAAEQNNPEALDRLCSAYYYGENIIRKDEAEAAKMCAGAGRKGKAGAAFLGAYLYDLGKGVPADP